MGIRVVNIEETRCYLHPAPECSVVHGLNMTREWAQVTEWRSNLFLPEEFVQISGDSVCSLLFTLHMIKTHLETGPHRNCQICDKAPQNTALYFMVQFPRLFLAVSEIVQESVWTQRTQFRPYYQQLATNDLQN